jgi:alpha-mannosidase
LFATLFRSFRRTIATGGEPDGLEKGKLTFQFALLPFAGELPRTIALRELSRLQTGIISRQSGQRPSGYPPLQGTATATRSFLQLVEGNLAVSAIKAPESRDGLILRLWNPTGEPQTETIRFWRSVHSIERLNMTEKLDSNYPSLLPLNRENEVNITAQGHQVITLGVIFDQPDTTTATAKDDHEPA